jgi:hypothetical protein
LTDGKSWPKVETIPKNIELSAMKNLSNFCKKGVRTYICFSLIMTPVEKMKDFIVEGNFMEKNLLRFHQIRLHITKTPPTKSGLQEENEKLKKWALKMASILPSHGTCAKTKRGFCYSSRYRENTLSVSQNSFYFAQNRFQKMTY